MIDKDSSIITQVAAKIASDIAAVSARGNPDLETTLSDFSTAFAYVKDELFSACAVTLAVTNLGATEVADVSPAPAPYTPPAAATGTLEVVGGKPFGPLPAWLEAATQKAGVRKVWDNRADVLNDDGSPKNKRPWFKQADQAQGVDPVAFWPPKKAA